MSKSEFAGLFAAVVVASAFTVVLLGSGPRSEASNSNTVATVDTAGYGENSSVAIGADGLPIISYNSYVLSPPDTDLKVAHCGNAACTAGNTLVILDANGGGQTSIAIGADGLPIVSYGGGALKVGHCAYADCASGNTLTTLDSTGDVGSFASLAIGTDGLPVISYYDWTNDQLNVAHCNDVSCTSATISVADSSGGLWASLVIGADGLPVISYSTQSNADLEVTHCGDISCSSGSTTTTIDTTSSVYDGTSLAIGTDGLPIIVYKDNSTHTLEVAHCSNVLCTASSIASVGSAAGNGEYVSIAIGTDGLPIISHIVFSKVRFIHCGNADCSAGNTTAQLADATGRQADITIGADGLPIISYPRGVELRALHCGDIACGALKPTPTPTPTATPTGHDAAVTALSWSPFGSQGGQRKISGTVENQGSVNDAYTITLRAYYHYDLNAVWTGQPGDTVQNGLSCGTSCPEPFYSQLTYQVPSIQPAASVAVSRSLSLACPAPFQVVPQGFTITLSASDNHGLDNRPNNDSMSGGGTIYCPGSTAPTPTATAAPVGGIARLPNLAGPSPAVVVDSGSRSFVEEDGAYLVAALGALFVSSVAWLARRRE